MKRLLASGFALALTVQLSGAALLTSQAATATDLQGYWAQQEIQKLMDRNVIGGYPDGTFRPNGQITRAEFAAILVKALNITPQANNYASFNDVPTYHWAYRAVESAKASNLISGYPGGEFRPNAPVSRVEAMAVLAKALPGQPDAATVEQTLSQFSDTYSIPSWGKAAVAETIQTGVYANNPNAGNQIEPNQQASRGEVAAMTSNLLARMNGSMNSNTATPVANNNGNYQQQVAVNQQQQQQQGQQTLQGRVVTVPENTEFVASLDNQFTTENAKVGDEIQLTVNMPLASQDNMIVVPSGTKVIGTINELDEAGRFEDNAKVGIKFKELVMANGNRMPIQGSVATDDGYIKAGSTGERVKDTAVKTGVGAAAGAALGTALGALSGGSVGKGAIYGTAIGGGLGAGASVINKGDDLMIPAGQAITIKLDAPLQMTVNQQ
jgi:hypothetical protein